MLDGAETVVLDVALAVARGACTTIALFGTCCTGRGEAMLVGACTASARGS